MYDTSRRPGGPGREKAFRKTNLKWTETEPEDSSRSLSFPENHDGSMHRLLPAGLRVRLSVTERAKSKVPVATRGHTGPWPHWHWQPRA
jgi:hypothetical protein